MSLATTKTKQISQLVRFFQLRVSNLAAAPKALRVASAHLLISVTIQPTLITVRGVRAPPYCYVGTWRIFAVV